VCTAILQNRALGSVCVGELRVAAEVEEAGVGIGSVDAILIDAASGLNSLENPRLFAQGGSFVEIGEENVRLIATFSFVGESDSEREAALRRDRRLVASDQP
jgi:hypothetical protein